MPAIEDLLQGILASEDSGSEDVEARVAENQNQELDVAGFVDNIGKTAELLDKAAESLPSSPKLVAEQLRMLKDPMNISREDVHEQHQDFVGQVLPAAKTSLGVPSSVEGIQGTVKSTKVAEEDEASEKVAEDANSGGWLLGQLGRR